MGLLILERKEERQSVCERERERERNIDWLPSRCALSRNQTPNILVYGTMLYTSGPQAFWHQGLVSWKTMFPWTGVVGDGLGLSQAHCIPAELLLCCPVPNRLGPILVHGQEGGDTCSKQ